jgi:hypothetical protein
MSEFLKGNFRVSRPISDKSPSEDHDSPAGKELQAKLKKVALASIGGSMVYMEREKLVWEGDDGEQ